MTDDHDSDRRLFVVDYDDDAERKRAEYLFDNWEGGSVESLDGLSRVATDVEFQELYDDLVAKVPEENIQVYELAEADIKSAPTETEIDRTLDAPADRVEWAMESIMNKRKAVAEDAQLNEYAVYTKKGRASIRYDISERDGETRLFVRIRGYGDAPEFLQEFVEDELSYMVG